ncbi:C4b-binding protein alpha chain-like isoform X2 [Mustelus asterias]
MSHSVGELLGEMSERLILALMALWVARVTGDCDRPPTLENGSPTDQFVSLMSFPVGTSVGYKCDPGYVSQEGRSIITTCLEDSTWTPLQVTCKLITCDDPEPISNGKISSPSGDAWQYGMIATYSCLDEYTLIGEQDISCTSSGKWNKGPPLCKAVSCQRPPLSENIDIVSGFGPTYKYRDTITYRCARGYVMVGSRIIECSADNTFVPSPPICKLPTSSTTSSGTAVTTAVTPIPKAVSCQRPPLSENIDIVSGFGPTYKYRDTITYRCARGYVMVGSRIIECSADNTFVPSPPICKLPTFSAAKLFKEMIALGRQLITKEEN